MNRALTISCITFGVLIIIICIVLIALQIDVKSTPGPPGNQGSDGRPEQEVSNTQSSVTLDTVNFSTPDGFIIFQNPKLKIINSGFIITALQTISLLPTDAIALFQLPAAFTPDFSIGAIGTIVNTLDVTQNHILLYDNSKTPNVSFLVRFVFTLQPSDRFMVNLLFVKNL